MEKVKAVIPIFQNQQIFYRLELLCGMALACEDLGKPDDARRLWNEAEAEIATNSPETQNGTGLLAIAKARAGDVKTAYRLIKSLGSRAVEIPEGRDESPELDSRFRNRCRVLQRIIADQFRREDFKGALESAAVMPESLPDGTRPRDEALKMMALYLWKSQQREFADQAMGRIQQPWVMDELLSELIPLQLSLGDAAAAKTSWNRITYKMGNVRLCVQIAVYLANHGNPQDAESSFTEAVALSTEVRPMSFGPVGRFQIQRITDLCGIAVAESSVKSPSARRTLDLAIKMAKEEPYDAAWREIDIAEAGCGMLQDALKTVEFIKGVDEMAKAQAGIALAQAEAGDREGARHRFNMAVEMTTGVDKAWTRVQLVTYIIEKSVKARELDLALELSKKISLEVERERTMVALVKEFLSARDMERAQAVRDHLTLDGFRREADASIVKFKINEGDLKRAYAVAKAMDGPERGDAMFCLIQAQIIARDFEGAALSARTWKTEGSSDHALGDVATELARTGDLQGALALIGPESRYVEQAYVWAGAVCGLAQRHANRQPANNIIAGLDWGWPFPRDSR